MHQRATTLQCASSSQVTNSRSVGQILGVLAALGLLAIFPLFAGKYNAVLMVTSFGYAIALLGLNLLFGYSGLLSLGHAMFLVIGAYAAAYLTKNGIFHIEIILIVAIAVAAATAAIIGALCVRYVKIYFGILTLAFSMLLYSFLFKFYSITGGDEGIRISRPTLLGSGFESFDGQSFLAGPFYYYALFLLALMSALMYMIVRSPFGLRLRATRDNATKAESLGVNISQYRLVAFVLAAIFGAIGGVIIGVPAGLAEPTLAYWVQSGNLVFMLLLGGYTSFLGPVLGAIVFIFFQDHVMSITEYWRFVFGSALALMIILMPKGLMGILDRSGKWSA